MVPAAELMVVASERKQAAVRRSVSQRWRAFGRSRGAAEPVADDRHLFAGHSRLILDALSHIKAARWWRTVDRSGSHTSEGVTRVILHLLSMDAVAPILSSPHIPYMALGFPKWRRVA